MKKLLALLCLLLLVLLLVAAPAQAQVVFHQSTFSSTSPFVTTQFVTLSDGSVLAVPTNASLLLPTAFAPTVVAPGFAPFGTFRSNVIVQPGFVGSRVFVGRRGAVFIR